MGMFDNMLNSGTPEYSTGDMLKAFIPIIGPVLAGLGVKKKKKQAEEKWLSDNLAYTNPAELDDVGRRVQQRMLQRTGGELSTPGLIAATAMKREAAEPSNMGNMGNILMQTAAQLAKSGEADAAAKLGMIAHKSFQTPWKASEGNINPRNYRLPNGQIVTISDPKAQRAAEATGATEVGLGAGSSFVKTAPGSEFGLSGPAAQDYYTQEFADEAKTVPIGPPKKLDNAPKVTVGGTSVNTPADISQTMLNFGNSYKGIKEMGRLRDGLIEVLDRNPTGGVQGWSGFISRTVGKVLNLTDFLTGLGQEEKQVMDKYTGSLTQYAKRYFPTADEAQANSLIIQLAYSIARINNMGTTGGGRGITDADMEFALQQLGSGATPEDMKGVVNRIYDDSLARFQDDYDVMEGTLRANGKEVPKEFAAFRDKAQSRTAPQVRPPKNWGTVNTLPKDLKKGDIVNGLEYLGGPVSNQSSWK